MVCKLQVSDDDEKFVTKEPAREGERAATYLNGPRATGDEFSYSSILRRKVAESRASEPPIVSVVPLRTSTLASLPSEGAETGEGSRRGL